jgi:hypothetical protein
MNNKEKVNCVERKIQLDVSNTLSRLWFAQFQPERCGRFCFLDIKRGEKNKKTKNSIEKMMKKTFKKA